MYKKGRIRSSMGRIYLFAGEIICYKRWIELLAQEKSNASSWSSAFCWNKFDGNKVWLANKFLFLCKYWEADWGSQFQVSDTTSVCSISCNFQVFSWRYLPLTWTVFGISNFPCCFNFSSEWNFLVFGSQSILRSKFQLWHWTEGISTSKTETKN